MRTFFWSILIRAASSTVSDIGETVLIENMAAMAQLAARRSHNPKVVDSILTGRMSSSINHY